MSDQNLDEVERQVAQQHEEDASGQLLQLMMDINHDCFSATWMHDAEHVLWAFAESARPRPWGGGDVTQERIDRLRALSVQSGGWWIWDGSGFSFMPLDAWIGRHKSWPGSSFYALSLSRCAP